MGGEWAPLVFRDAGRRQRVVRSVYEITTFQVLRDLLRCKENWVVGPPPSTSAYRAADGSGVLQPLHEPPSQWVVGIHPVVPFDDGLIDGGRGQFLICGVVSVDGDQADNAIVPGTVRTGEGAAMGSLARQAFLTNCEEIDRLAEIHGDITPSGRGRKWKVEALHKAAFVLITAFWEAFCEDLAAEGLQHLVEHGAADRLPKHLQKQVARELKEENHELAIWRLAGDGWRDVLTRRLAQMAEERNRNLNTPKSVQINTLFANTLGVENVAESWTWTRMSAGRAQEKLDDFISRRGDIAHRGTAAESVTKKDVTNYYNHVKELVDCTEKRIATALHESTATAPW